MEIKPSWYSKMFLNGFLTIFFHVHDQDCLLSRVVTLGHLFILTKRNNINSILSLFCHSFRKMICNRSLFILYLVFVFFFKYFPIRWINTTEKPKRSNFESEWLKTLKPHFYRALYIFCFSKWEIKGERTFEKNQRND